MCLKIEIEILNILEINNLYVIKCKIISHFLSVIISGYVLFNHTKRHNWQHIKNLKVIKITNQ